MSVTLIRILLVEDNPNDIFLIKRMLNKFCNSYYEFRIDQCGLLSEALKYLNHQEPDVILLDLGLPDSNGLQILTSIIDLVPSIPIVVLTGLEDEDVAIEALQQGAQDYLIKGQVEGNLLARSLRYAIGRKGATEELKKAILELREANERLTVLAKELEQRNNEISLLGQMGDFLQGCNTIEEAYITIRRPLQQLFLNDSGAVYIFNSPHTLVEATTIWGDDPPAEMVIAPDECWALRRGRPHGAAEIRAGFQCRHTEADKRAYICVPLVAHGEAIGMLHVLLGFPDQAQAEIKQNLAVRVAAYLGMALAKLRLQETLQYLSVRDPLTSLFNRRYMEESMERELRRAERQGKQVGVIMMDIDHFKRFNDTFGHEAGDALLQHLGTFLQQHIRGGDIACRYGGEEFTLILQDVSLEMTQQRAEQMREAAKHLQILHGQRLLGPITISLGVAMFPIHGTTAMAVLQAADFSLYRAKETGRDRVCLAGKDRDI